MKRRLPHLVIFVLIAAAYTFDLLAPLDRLIMDLRFRLAERPASGTVVVVEIDAKSLRELDVWPWPRRYHAALLDRLVAAGARNVAFDVDFSSRSTAEGDHALAEALARAGGRVSLPILKQVARTENGSTQVVTSLPIAEFRPHIEPAHVNVRVGPDNLVRHYLAYEPFGGIDVPGLATRLADEAAPPPRIFMIDYGITPDSVSRLSYVDVMRGRVDPRAIAGKNVIVGAAAVELGDRLPTPVYGVMTGPMVQALAYETIAQGRIISPLAGWPVLLATLLLALVLGARLTDWTWRQGLAACFFSGAVFVASSIAAQAEFLLAIDVAPSILMVLGSYGYGVVVRIDRQAATIYRERMLSQHRRAMMSTVVESSFDGIVITDEDGLIQMSTAAANDMMGWDDVEIIGQRVDDHIPRPEIVGDGIESADDNPVPPREVEARRGDGTTFTMELVVNTSRLSMAFGGKKSERTDKTVRIFTFRDVTERKRTEQARQRAMEEAVAANRAKTEFLANMSHELRTPLNAIIGFSDVMRTEALGPLGVPDYAEFVGDIYDSGHHLLEVVEDILDMSKIEAGEMTLSESKIELAGIVDAGIRMVRERAEKANLTIATELAAELPRVNADERMMKQILLNLLSNAVKFTPEGGTVSVRASQADDGGITIAVADTGIGIPAEDIERVLEPFAQVDSRLQREFEGTGLGLPLVKSMTELHGGRLRIESTVDEGTTVYVELPAERTGARRDPEVETAGALDAAA